MSAHHTTPTASPSLSQTGSVSSPVSGCEKGTSPSQLQRTKEDALPIDETSSNATPPAGTAGARSAVAARLPSQETTRILVCHGATAENLAPAAAPGDSFDTTINSTTSNHTTLSALDVEARARDADGVALGAAIDFASPNPPIPSAVPLVTRLSIL